MARNLDRRVGAAAVLLGCALVGAAQVNGQRPARSAGVLETMMKNLQGDTVGPLPKRTAPAGYTVFQDPAGTGRGLYGTFNGNATSATMAARGLLGGFRGYFDNTPAITAAFRDGADHRFQAQFSAAIAGSPVLGVIGVDLANGGGSVSLLFDRPASLGASFPRLQTLLAARSGSTTGGRPVALVQTTLSDGSTISVPQGWRAASGHPGAVDVFGPHGEIMSLGGAVPVYSAAPRMRMPVNYVLVAPCCDPERAWTTLFPQIASINAGAGAPPMRLMRFVEKQPVQSPFPGGQAAFTLSEITIAGRPGFAFYLVIAMPASADVWTYYTSGMSATADVFKEEFGTMQQIWSSWSVNPQVFIDRLGEAMKSMQATQNIMREVQANRTRASLSAAEGWSEVIRGVQTIERSDGTRVRGLDNRRTQQIVDALNANGYGPWHVVLPSDLVP